MNLSWCCSIIAHNQTPLVTLIFARCKNDTLAQFHMQNIVTRWSLMMIPAAASTAITAGFFLQMALMATFGIREPKSRTIILHVSDHQRDTINYPSCRNSKEGRKKSADFIIIWWLFTNGPNYFWRGEDTHRQNPQLCTCWSRGPSCTSVSSPRGSGLVPSNQLGRWPVIIWVVENVH